MIPEGLDLLAGISRFLTARSDIELQMAGVQRMASVAFEALRDEKAARQRGPYDWPSSSSDDEDFGPTTIHDNLYKQ